MPIDVVVSHACVLILCECGEYVSLSDESVETCSSCLRKYKIEVNVTEIEYDAAESG